MHLQHLLIPLRLYLSVVWGFKRAVFTLMKEIFVDFGRFGGLDSFLSTVAPACEQILLAVRRVRLCVVSIDAEQ